VKPGAIVVAVLVAIAALSGRALAAGTQGAPAAGERHLTILYTAEVHGVLEPCGCTSDPLGDVARYATVIAATRREAGAVLLVDGGGLSYPEGGIPARERSADELRAAFLATELGKRGLRGAGLAETDVPPGGARVDPARLAANLQGGPSPSLRPSLLESAGGIKVGILGVADPALGETLKVKADDPVAAARREAERLRKAGAELVVALGPVDKAVARRLAREAAVDFVVLGRQVGAGTPRAEPVGHAFLLAPADELQRVGRLDLVVRGTGAPFVDAGGPEANELRRAEIDRALARIDAELARWASGGGAGADPAFVAAKKRERDDLGAERARLAAPWSPPPGGSYFTNRLIPLRRSLPRDPAAAAALRQLDARIAVVNLRAASPPPPPEPGRPSFVGMAKCAPCHKAAVAFWGSTVHAHAWQTLVDVGKQADYKCVGCHVTGYGQVGGSSLGHTRRLENVQCETCHGPGSLHVEAKGLEDPPSVHRQTPETTCTGCHNERHSDTFQVQAYLRDVLGAGHGAAARGKLGDGPTGRQLRAAAQAKAAGAAQVQKLQ
jgi:Cytochrome c554 and c-prime